MTINFERFENVVTYVWITQVLGRFEAGADLGVEVTLQVLSQDQSSETPLPLLLSNHRSHGRPIDGTPHDII